MLIEHPCTVGIGVGKWMKNNSQHHLADMTHNKYVEEWTHCPKKAMLKNTIPPLHSTPAILHQEIHKHNNIDLVVWKGLNAPNLIVPSWKLLNASRMTWHFLRLVLPIYVGNRGIGGSLQKQKTDIIKMECKKRDHDQMIWQQSGEVKGMTQCDTSYPFCTEMHQTFSPQTNSWPVTVQLADQSSYVRFSRHWRLVVTVVTLKATS